MKTQFRRVYLNPYKNSVNPEGEPHEDRYYRRNFYPYRRVALAGKAFKEIELDFTGNTILLGAEGVSRTYKSMDGYSLIFTYIGKEGYMLNCELRPGKQHCQKNTPEYLEKELKIIKELALNDPVLLRLDSGNDAYATLIPLMRSGHFYLVKRNLQREFLEKWVDIGRAMGE